MGFYSTSIVGGAFKQRLTWHTPMPDLGPWPFSLCAKGIVPNWGRPIRPQGPDLGRGMAREKPAAAGAGPRLGLAGSSRAKTYLQASTQLGLLGCHVVEAEGRGCAQGRCLLILIRALQYQLQLVLI